MTRPTADPAVIGGVEVLDADRWHALRDAHHARASALLDAVVQRRRDGRKHPVEDFLFTYYTLRPGHLLAWQPGVGRALRDAEDDFRGVADHVTHQVSGERLVTVDAAGVASRRATTIAWTRRLLEATAGRPASFGCFGMHEWAMVYGLRPDQTRHPGLPLRYPVDETRRIVDEVGLRCTHFDAFRFFTPEAAPRNSTQLTREGQPDHDQPGCLHANMDLYKWAGKLGALVSSELLLDCFELARAIRTLDMQASAYDLAEWGYSPVAVETPAGRAEYVARQRAFSARAQVLRQRLLDVLDAVEALRAAATASAA